MIYDTDDCRAGPGERPGRSYMSAFASGNSRGAGIRNALPYYELSVEVRGPTLSSITDPGRRYSTNSQPRRTSGSCRGASSTTWAYSTQYARKSPWLPRPALSDATVAITPTDANSTAAGHQIRPADPARKPSSSSRSPTGRDTETYTVKLSKP